MDKIPLSVFLFVFYRSVFLTEWIKYEVSFVVVDLVPTGCSPDVCW
jgi:hypothetical protein